MNDGCPYCNQFKIAGDKFCGKCGRDLSDYKIKEPKASWDPIKMVCVATAIIVALILIIELAAMFIFFGDVFSYLDTYEVRFFVIVPLVEVFFSTTGLGGQLYWILLVAIITICALYTLKRFIESIIVSIKTNTIDSIEKTEMFWVALFLCGMLTVSFVFTLILTSLGSGIDSPIDLDDKYDLLYSLANAAVWEELITRVLYLGLPMALIALFLYKDHKCWRYLFGGFEMNRIAVIFIIFSAIMFGFGHYDGWGFEKVPLAALMGVVLGYIFVRFGLHACILLHFINDYLISLTWMGLGQAGLGGVTLILMAVGLIALIYILLKMIKKKDSLRNMSWWNSQ